MGKVLFLRKKMQGENSIEEIAFNLVAAIPDLKLLELPEYGTSLKGILKNILFVRRNSSDINHFFSSSDTYLIPFCTGKKIVTWHDVGTAFYTKSKKKKWIKKYLLRYLPMLFCDVITCISSSTYNEVLSEFPKVKKKLTIIPNPYNPLLKRTEQNITEIPLILHIGTGSRKNLERVIEALSDIKCQLFIVGKLSSVQLTLLRKYKIDYYNEFDVPFSRIVELYKQCTIVSFPSLYEGFGMPVIEANAVGRPILTSKVGAIPEIAKDAAYYANPYSITELKTAFKFLLNRKDVCNDLIQKGICNAQKYSIDKIAQQYSDLYCE